MYINQWVNHYPELRDEYEEDDNPSLEFSKIIVGSEDWENVCPEVTITIPIDGTTSYSDLLDSIYDTLKWETNIDQSVATKLLLDFSESLSPLSGDMSELVNENLPVADGEIEPYRLKIKLLLRIDTEEF